MGAGYMQSISVPRFRSPVFSELQGPIQDGYGIRQGWIHHLRVCILQTLCSYKGQTTGRTLGTNAARVQAVVRPCDKFAGAQGLQDTNTEMLYPSLTYAVSILHRLLQLAENRKAKMRNRNRLHVSRTHPLDDRWVATKMAAATNAAT